MFPAERLPAGAASTPRDESYPSGEWIANRRASYRRIMGAIGCAWRGVSGRNRRKNLDRIFEKFGPRNTRRKWRGIRCLDPGIGPRKIPCRSLSPLESRQKESAKSEHFD